MKKWESVKTNLLKNAEVRAEYEKFDPEYDFGELMTKTRKEAKLTQSQVAEKMGVKQSAISRLESGVLDIKVSTFLSYLNACGRKIAII